MSRFADGFLNANLTLRRLNKSHSWSKPASLVQPEQLLLLPSEQGQRLWEGSERAGGRRLKSKVGERTAAVAWFRRLPFRIDDPEAPLPPPPSTNARLQPPPPPPDMLGGRSSVSR